MMNGKRVEPPNGRQWDLSVGGKCIVVWNTFPDEESRNRDHHFLGNIYSYNEQHFLFRAIRQAELIRFMDYLILGMSFTYWNISEPSDNI